MLNYGSAGRVRLCKVLLNYLIMFFCQDWFQYAKRFLRWRLNCEKLKDDHGRKDMTISQMTFPSFMRVGTKKYIHFSIISSQFSHHPLPHQPAVVNDRSLEEKMSFVWVKMGCACATVYCICFFKNKQLKK
jgi:hypothetical protein